PAEHDLEASDDAGAEPADVEEAARSDEPEGAEQSAADEESDQQEELEPEGSDDAEEAAPSDEAEDAEPGASDEESADGEEPQQDGGEPGEGAAPASASPEEESEEELVDGIPRDLLDAPDEDEAELRGADSPERPGLEKAKPKSVGEEHLKSVLESLVFVSDKPVPAKRLARVARARTKEVVRLLGELVEEYRGRGIELVELAGGYQFRSAAVNAPFVREILETKPVRLTRAQLETLAICAYRQPLTRPEIEEIRGVDSGSALKVLLERGLVKIL